MSEEAFHYNGRTMRGLRSILIAGLFATSAGTAAQATVYVAADLTDLVNESRAIVYGRVSETRAVLVDSRQRVETLVTLDVEAALKGEPGRTVVFRVPGGEIGRYRSILVGAPTFELDAEVVVFLAGAAPAIPHVVGLSQGVLRVARDSRSESLVVMAPPMSTESTPQRVVRGDPARRPVAIEQFVADVRAMVRASVARRPR